MQNVPKIVRERLRAATPAVNHPDADALTAFAEHSLPGLERDVVLEHLARCGDCRDIVALALPAMESEPVGRAIKPSPSGWLTWPALRWAFVAAGVVVIASVGILRYQAHFQRSMSASYKAPAPQAETTEAKNQPLATPAPVAAPPAEKDEKIQSPAAPASATALEMNNAVVSDNSVSDSAVSNAVSNKKSALHAAPPPPPALAQPFHGGASGRSIGGPVVANQYSANQWQQNMAQNQAAAPAPSSTFGKQQAADMKVPAAGQGAGASGAALVDTLAQNTDANMLQYQPAAQPPAAKDKDIMRAKPLPQPAPGQIGGHVVDPSGAVVSNARITVIPSKAGGITNTVTDSQGAWLIAGLPSGNYRVQAQAPGFTTAVKDLHYDANQPSMYSFTLSPGSVSEMVEVSAQNVQVQADTETVSGAIMNREVSQVPINGRNVTRLVALSPGGLQTVWSLNPSGGLQRSFDQGKTWQAVDVNGTPALNGANLAVAAETVEVTTAQAKTAQAPTAQEKTKALAKSRKGIAALTFRALAVAGSDVWVGGSGGALYRSSDAGNHWTRVVPVASGTALTDDVVSLEFSDSQHGKFSTSVGEVWTTADAGQTWQKK